MAPGHHQYPRERPQRVRPLGRGRLRRHELDRALDCGKSGVVAAGLVEILAEPHVQERRTVRVCVADELDRAPAELVRARRRARLAGQLACPRAELGEVEPDELGRVRHRVPERERPLEVGESLREAEDRLRLPRRLDRRGERFRAATRRRPVGCQLRRRLPLHCARARRRCARAIPRAHRAGSSCRWLPRGARGGNGSCSVG